MMGVGFLLFILLLVAVGYIAYRIGQNRSTGAGVGRRDARDTDVRSGEAMEVVRRRYAQGEIDRDEFERLRRDLG
jgi:uncharacterized membrane protein